MNFRRMIFKGSKPKRDERHEGIQEGRAGLIEEEVFLLFKNLSKLVGKSIDYIELGKRICMKLSELKQRCSVDKGSMEVYSKEAKAIREQKWFIDLVSKFNSLAQESAEMEDKGKEQKIYKRIMHLHFYTESPELAIEYAMKRIRVLSILKKEEDEPERIAEVIDKTIRFSIDVIDEFSKRGIIAREKKIELLMKIEEELKFLAIKGGAAVLVSKQLDEAEKSQSKGSNADISLF
ncbi:MAG: hypothetical protein QW035_01395 [Candidatus Anstonellales archaeon]